MSSNISTLQTLVNELADLFGPNWAAVTDSVVSQINADPDLRAQFEIDALDQATAEALDVARRRRRR
jgi:hypothetical protein